MAGPEFCTTLSITLHSTDFAIYPQVVEVCPYFREQLRMSYHTEGTMEWVVQKNWRCSLTMALHLHGCLFSVAIGTPPSVQDHQPWLFPRLTARADSEAVQSTVRL
jgi:hypothetical protein